MIFIPFDKEPAMNHIKILVVDDDPVTQAMLKKTLTKADYEVDIAENGAQAITFVTDNYYDVVITDLMMPGGPDGIDVLESVKKNNSETEVFLLTGYASVDTAVIAMKKGAADYLQKPVNVEELQLRINRIKGIKALTKRAGDLRDAMDRTEKNAGETIQNLEIINSDLHSRLLKIEKILTDDTKDAYSKIETSLELIPYGLLTKPSKMMAP